MSSLLKGISKYFDYDPRRKQYKFKILKLQEDGGTSTYLLEYKYLDTLEECRRFYEMALEAGDIYQLYIRDDEE